MKKRVMALVFLMVSIFLIALPTYCESGVIYTQGAKDNAKARAEGTTKSAVIQNTKRNVDHVKIDTGENDIKNMSDYPVAIGHGYTRVTNVPDKVPFTIVIESPYCFINDETGNIGIAYMDERINAPVIAMGGFYVVQKQNETTKEVEWVKYCVDNAGYILFGWLIESNGNKYYLSEDTDTLGQVVKGAKMFADGKTYYFDEDGILQNY